MEGKGNTERLTYKTNGKYMNTVVEQAPPYAIDCDIDTAITKLAEYENLEEQKKLLTLPCAVGDTVYVKMQSGGYAEAEVRDFSHFLSCGFCVVVTSDKFNKQHIPFTEFGKTVFLTKPAEAALKELKSGGIE